MFKRANKITALLVAAASVMSVVPAMAADSTNSSRLESKDGTIENAIAYKDGKYVYQGYKSSDDDDAIYYNGGDKDKALDDLSSADLNTSYSDKYAFANDGSDQYLVDLTSGDVTDDTTPADDIDTAATKLQTKLKKASRYDSDLTGLTAEDTLGYSGADNAVGTLPGNKFGDNWYSYKVATSTSDAKNYVTDGYLFGFTGTAGKYIDASYLANIYAYSTKEGKTVKIENYSNNMDDVDSDSKLLATLIGQPVVLTQNTDYIYALVKVAITDSASNATVTNGATTAAAAYVNGNTTDVKTTVRTYVQKISKAQGEQKDDAYVPKTVISYEVGNANGTEYNCDDAQDAYKAIATALNVTDLTTATQEDAIDTTSDNGIVRPKFTTVNGNLVAIDATSSKVDATTLLFKKDKVKFKIEPGYKAASATTTTASASTFNLDTKVDTYFVEKDSDDSVDLNDNSNTEYTESYDIDIDGNIWVVADGKIYKYENGDMTKIYTCDSSLDSISIYDENNLVAWENNGDIYTTVNEGSTKAEAPAAATTTAKIGWSQLADGTWNFYDATGTKVVNNWANIAGVWYYLKADGVMATGWLNDNGTWYYLASSGAMKTGWLNDNGTWYYLNASGAMAANTTVDGYTLNASGAWVN